MATNKYQCRVLDQHQALLFRVPREIRDGIYGYYSQDSYGLTFDPLTRKLRSSNGQPVELALGYTCKRIATELDGMALRSNSIRFHTLLDRSNVANEPSDSALFDHLLEIQAVRLRHMLRWACTTITTDVMQRLELLYPNRFAVQSMAEKFERDGVDLFRDGYLPLAWHLDDYNNDPILMDLVKVMATVPGFHKLTSKAYDPEWRKTLDEESRSRPPAYSKETQPELLQWRPKLWWIPDRAELNAVLRFLPPWPTSTFRSETAGGRIPRMNFSAAAVAIRFLEELNPNIRKHIRKIVIQEDHISVATSKAHAQGLIPFCIANPDLRIERRIDVWSTEFLHRSKYFLSRTCEIIKLIATWINEAKILHQMGMPVGSFTLVLHGPSERATQQLSDAMMRASIWQDGAIEIARRQHREFDWYQKGVYQDDFVDVMKEMFRGDIPASFDGADMGEVWDIEKILREHVGDWPNSVHDVFSLQDFEEPDGGWEAARISEMHEQKVDWLERMDGWRCLTGEESFYT